MKFDFTNVDKAVIAQGLACETVEALKELIKANNIDVPEDEAEKLFAAIAAGKKEKAELSEEELDKVAGGMWGDYTTYEQTEDGVIVTLHHKYE